MGTGAVVVDRAGIEAAYRVIQPHVRRTPILQANGADFGLPPFRLTLKLEQLQFAGSFKTRGAFANLLLRAVPAAGVVAASGGNHGRQIVGLHRRSGDVAIDRAQGADKTLQRCVLPDVTLRINLHHVEPALADKAFAQNRRQVLFRDVAWR